MAKITEQQVSSSDISALFKAATEPKKQSGLLGKLLGGKDRPKLTVDELQQAWKEEGYPDDIRDITAILKSKGYDGRDIQSIISDVLGSSGENASTDAVTRVVSFVKKNGIEQEVLAFLKKEYNLNESSQDIFKIFKEIVKEDRVGLKRDTEKSQIGRNKK
jgi:hypothetical protein